MTLRRTPSPVDITEPPPKHEPSAKCPEWSCDMFEIVGQCEHSPVHPDLGPIPGSPEATEAERMTELVPAEDPTAGAGSSKWGAPRYPPMTDTNPRPPVSTTGTDQ